MKLCRQLLWFLGSQILIKFVGSNGCCFFGFAQSEKEKL